MSDIKGELTSEPVATSEESVEQPWEKALKKLQDIIPAEKVHPGFFDLEYLPVDEEGRLQTLALEEIKLKNGHLTVTRSNHGQEDNRFFSIFVVKHADQRNELIHEQVVIKTVAPDAPRGKIVYDKLTFNGQVGHADNENPDVEERVQEFLDRMGEMVRNAPPPNGNNGARH